MGDVLESSGKCEGNLQVIQTRRKPGARWSWRTTSGSALRKVRRGVGEEWRRRERGGGVMLECGRWRWSWRRGWGRGCRTRCSASSSTCPWTGRASSGAASTASPATTPASFYGPTLPSSLPHITPQWCHRIGTGSTAFCVHLSHLHSPRASCLISHSQVYQMGKEGAIKCG